MKSRLFLLVLLLGLMSVPALAADPAVFQIRLVRERASDDTERVSLTITSRDGKSSATELLHLEKGALLDGTAIESATATTGGADAIPQIELRFNPAGKKKLAEVSTKHVGERLAFLVEGKALTAPLIREPIKGGAAVVSGSFNEAEAKELAAKINAVVKK